MSALLKLGEIAGVTGIALGVIYLVNKQLLNLDIFSRLNRWLTFFLLMFIVFCIWTVAIIAILGDGELNIVIGDWNITGVTK
ncbi:hypothetical protein [Pseudovibrio sp. FO-BEG1]|uniref:hypothetical protein n=1 Tax=Pseudovibrio sp. (strain FO-BEG1) TaxID=911045 RepID=UPI0005A23948|nr:hypothetical protein [Pseudovibrio sp. FO-BEG1]